MYSFGGFSQPELEPDPELEPEPELDPEPELEPESELEPELDPESELAPELDPELELDGFEPPLELLLHAPVPTIAARAIPPAPPSTPINLANDMV